MVIRRPLPRHLAQRKPIQHLIPQQQILPVPPSRKHSLPGRPYAFFKLRSMPAQHQLEQLGHGLGVLPYLGLGRRVQDREAGVDVPFVGVDPQCDVRFHVLDPAHVPARLPGELIVRAPRRAHAQECRVRDGLRVGGDAVVGLGREVYVLGAEAGEDARDEGEAGIGGAVLDQH